MASPRCNPDDLSAASSEADGLAAIVELLSRAAVAKDSTSACQILVQDLRDFLGFDCVALGLTGRGEACRVRAVSGLRDIDPRAERVCAMEVVMAESITAGRSSQWPAVEEPDASRSFAMRKLADAAGAGEMICMPLRLAGGSFVGSLLCIAPRNGNVPGFDRAGWLEAARESLATVLALQLRAERSRSSQFLSRVLQLSGSRRKLLGFGCLLSAALMMVPLPDRIQSNCELQPAVRRFIAAPHAGIFQRSLVEPGDMIEAGEVLALMDDRDVRWELTSVEAEQSRAAKSRDVNMAAGKVAAAQIDSLDVQRLELKRKQLLKRLEHLEVKSPISGIVVSGDLKRSEGMPATVGQVLYEIAPLNQMIAELEISDREIGRLREGAEVSLRLDAFPGQTWSGVVARIHPRSEVRESENVFIAEVELDNFDSALRPGMAGRATIDADNRALWHSLVREPWMSLTRALGW